MTFITCEDCKKKKDSVKGRQGDLILCLECNAVRFPTSTKMPSSKPNIANAKPMPESVQLKKASDHITQRHASIIRTMNIQEAKTFNELAIMQNVQKDLSSVMPEGFDPAIIANASFDIASKLKQLCDSRVKNLTQDVSPASMVQAIFATPLLQALTPRPQATNTNIGAITDTTTTPRKVTAKKIKCTDSCSMDHVDQGKTMTCLLCDTCFHQQCLEFKRKPTVYVCSSCKGMSRLLQAQAATMASLQSSLESCQKQLKHQQFLISELDNPCPLRPEMCDATTATRTAALIDELSEANSPGETPMDTEPRNPSSTEEPVGAATAHDISVKQASKGLLIGDSIIRDIQERGLSGCDVKCLRGARISNIRQTLQSMDINGTYGTIIIHAGTNDCTSDSQQSEAAQEYESMIKDIQNTAPNTAIVISTVCPRSDDIKHEPRVDRMNSDIKQIAEDRGCIIVDNDLNFKMNDKSTDPSVMNNRGLHLNKRGTKRLLKNIDAAHPIIIKRQVSSTSRSSERQHEFRRDSYNGRHHPRRHQDNSHPRGYYSGQSFTNDTYARESYGERDMQENLSYGRGRGCYKCGGLNHVRKNCHYERPVQCHNCGKYGHKSYQNICHMV